MSIEKATRYGRRQYRARIQIRRTIFRSPWFETEGEAKEWEATKRVEVKEGLANTGRHTTVAEFAKLWLEKHAFAHKTYGAAVRDEVVLRKYLVPAFGVQKLRRVTLQQLSFYFADLARAGKLAPKTINNCIGTVKKMFADAVKWQYIGVSPAEGLQLMKIPTREVTYFHRDEINRLLSFTAAHYPEEHRLIVFALNTGCRLGECLGLTWEKVDLSSRSIVVSATYADKERKVVERTKGKKFRIIPLNSDCAELLRSMQLHGRPGESPIVFSRVSYLAFTNYKFQRILKRAGLEDAIRRGAVGHSLRHTFATEFMRAGGDIWKLQKLLGHSTVTQTEKYAHFAPGHLSGATDLVSFSGSVGRVIPLVDKAR